MKQDTKEKIEDSKDEAKLVCRNDFLFLAGATAVVAGLVFGLPSYVLDVLLIFSISLTAAVLITALCARHIEQVQSFPLFIVMAATLRLAVSVASGKMLLSNGQAGTIINFFGHLIVRDNFVPSILIFGILAVVFFGAICKAVRDITRTGTKLAAGLADHKRNDLERDLQAGLINNQEAASLRGEINLESGFFTAMAGAGRFMLCIAVIDFVVIVSDMVGALAAGSGTAATAELSTRTYVILAVGAGMITQICSLVTALASRYLVRNSPVGCEVNAEFGQGPAEKIEVVASEVSADELAITQDNNETRRAESSAKADGQCGFRESLQQFLLEQAPERNAARLGPEPQPGGVTGSVGEDEVCAEFTEIENRPVQNENQANVTEIAEDVTKMDEQETADGQNDSNQAEADYDGWTPTAKKGGWYAGQDYSDSITKIIGDALADELNTAQTILMAAEYLSELPVTIPVNIAIRLAQQGQKCLLIDLDVEREAIAKVFDIEAGHNSKQCRSEGPQWRTTAVETRANNRKGSTEPLEFQTCISNLWVWPTSNFYKASVTAGAKSLTELIAELENRYEHLIIYAPNAKVLPLFKRTSKDQNKLPVDWEQLAGSIHQALLFGDGEQENGFVNSFTAELHKLLTSYGCRVVRASEFLAEAV